MTKEEFLERVKNDSEYSPGWQAIDDAFEELYPGQEPDTACRKTLGGGQGAGDRQLQHQVGSTGNGGLGPEAFVKQGRVAPLDKIAAHKAHHSLSPVL